MAPPQREPPSRGSGGHAGVHRAGSRGTVPDVTWGFLWLMFALKIPIVGLLWIVWWAIKAEPEPEQDPKGGGGGTKQPRHPRRPFPRHPRRGPHGDPALPAPRRTRSVVVRAKRADHAQGARTPPPGTIRPDGPALCALRRDDPPPGGRRSRAHRAVGRRHGPAGQRRPAPGQLVPRLPQPPHRGHRPG